MHVPLYKLCASCGRRVGEAGFLGFVWKPWGRGRTPGPRVAAVGAWPVPWGLCGRHGGAEVPWVRCSRRWGVVFPLGFVWTPFELRRSPGLVGEDPLGLLWPTWGRGR